MRFSISTLIGCCVIALDHPARLARHGVRQCQVLRGKVHGRCSAVDADNLALVAGGDQRAAGGAAGIRPCL